MIKVIAIGRLTKALEIIETVNENQKVSNFNLACRSNKITEFIQCTAWNDVARVIQENTSKGSLLYIEGKYHTASYVDEKTQVKHTRIYIIVDKFEFLDAKPKTETLPLDDSCLSNEDK